MTKLIRVCVVVLAVAVLTMVVASGVAMAADDATGHVAEAAAGTAAATEVTYKIPALAALAAGLVITGSGFGIGWIGSRAVESMARQPELAGQIQMAMILAAALIEGATLFALAVCILCVL